jgi:hypothetical protein
LQIRIRLAVIPTSPPSNRHLYDIAAGSTTILRGTAPTSTTNLQRLGVIPLGSLVPTPWLNKAAFTTPAVGTFGNAGTRTVAGPSQWDFDMALSRFFQINETQRLEFRWEAYNVTNSFRPLNPNSDITSAQFGQLRTARSPRIMQFALKYLF